MTTRPSSSERAFSACGSPPRVRDINANAASSDAWLIPADAHAIARRGVLFYPCAGPDTEEAVDAFALDVTAFWFSDLDYQATDAGFVAGCSPRGSMNVRGVPNASMGSRRTEGLTHRWIEPCVWTARMRHNRTAVDITVHWRRGFGEYALEREFADRSISVFMHRGDSPGEGGSGSYFLGRRLRRHEPLSRLFDKLAAKLQDEALIISDGSNCALRQLRAFHKDMEIEPSAAMDASARPFERWGFRWKCIGYIGRHKGPTLIWRVTRLPQALST